MTAVQTLKRSYGGDADMKQIKDHIAQIESNGSYDARNPKSSAYGKYQLLNGTYKSVAEKLGVPEDQLKTPEGQEKAMDYLLTEYANTLQALGQDTTKANMYIMHQLGQSRGERYFKNNLTSKDYTLMWKNLPKASQEKVDRRDHKAIKAEWDSLYAKG